MRLNSIRPNSCLNHGEAQRSVCIRWKKRKVKQGAWREAGHKEGASGNGPRKRGRQDSDSEEGGCRAQESRKQARRERGGCVCVCVDVTHRIRQAASTHPSGRASHFQPIRSSGSTFRCAANGRWATGLCETGHGACRIFREPS